MRAIVDLLFPVNPSVMVFLPSRRQWSVVEQIIKERENGGLFRSMDDFVERMSNKEVNKRTLENFIKSRGPGFAPGQPQAEVHGSP